MCRLPSMFPTAMTARIPEPTPSPADYRPLAILVGAAFFMEQLDATIVSPAMPDIARDMGIEPLSLNVTMTVYLLCSLIFIPLSGLLAARFGTRTVFRYAVAVFVASSAACALSPDLVTLTVARAAQGFAAAMMVPVGRTAIVHTTRKSELVAALAWMITPAMLGPVLGPPLGGLLCAWLSWHWVFLINVPVGLLGLLVAGRVMPQLRSEADAVFDVWEWSLAAAALTLLVVAIEGARHAPDLGVLSAQLGALAALVWLYRRRFRRSVAPLLDFRLLAVRTFATGFFAGALVRVGYGAIPFLLPLMLQLGLGFSPIQSGLVLLASGVIAMVTKTGTTAMLRRWGFRRVLLWNGVMCAVGLAGCAVFAVPGWGLAAIAAVVSLAGFFRAVQFNALTAIAYADLPRSRIAAATTLNTMGWQLAIMFGISLSALVVQMSARIGERAHPAATDFATAFLIVAAFAFAAIPAYLALSRQAGEELSGHRTA